MGLRLGLGAKRQNTESDGFGGQCLPAQPCQQEPEVVAGGGEDDVVRDCLSRLDVCRVATSRQLEPYCEHFADWRDRMYWNRIEVRRIS